MRHALIVRWKSRVRSPDQRLVARTGVKETHELRGGKKKDVSTNGPSYYSVYYFGLDGGCSREDSQKAKTKRLSLYSSASFVTTSALSPFLSLWAKVLVPVCCRISNFSIFLVFFSGP